MNLFRDKFCSLLTNSNSGQTKYSHFFVDRHMERRIYNPIQKDSVVFLKTAADTNGECTLVEVELADGGGVGLHFHKTYSESFACTEGELQVKLGKKVHTLKVGENATADPHIKHLF